MDNAKTLTFYLNDAMRQRAKAGETNIINLIMRAFLSQGYKCLFKENTMVNLLSSAADPGFSMFHMEEPFHPRALNLRRAYFYPFWRIEASAKRWEWGVARARFESEKVDPDQVKQFVAFWRNRLFKPVSETRTHPGFIFAPLQGLLQVQRTFQTMSPLAMLETTLTMDPARSIHVSLHPRETYSKIELDALSNLMEKNPRLKLVSNDSGIQLQNCDYVVSQNSSLALEGYFFHKPAILFASIDFHHIAENISEKRAEDAFANALRKDVDYDAYLYWFLQMHSINAGRKGAEQKILATVRENGWDI